MSSQCDVSNSSNCSSSLTLGSSSSSGNLSGRSGPSGFQPLPPFEDGLFLGVLHGIVVPVLFGIIIFLGVGGNSLVIYVIVSRERMRTVTNILLLNLAVADLLFLLFIPSFTAYQYATTRWPFGSVVCKLMHYIVNVTAYVTVYTLVLISAVRYMTIVHSISTVQLRTTTNTFIVIASLWTTMLLLNIPVLGAYAVKSVEHLGVEEMQCQHSTHEDAQTLFATFFLFAYLLPLGVIAVLSVCIVHHLTKHRSEILDRRNRSSTTRKKRAGLLLILVVLAFALLWLPIHVHLLAAFFGSVPTDRFYMAAGVLWHCLAYFNSCVNPFIYNYTSKDFRDAFRDVACCHRNAEEEPDVVAHSNTTQLQLTCQAERMQLCDASGDPSQQGLEVAP